MISILPMPHPLLTQLCQELHIDTDAPVWGWTSSQGARLLGYTVIARAGDGPCRILALQAEDREAADGLLRAALHPFFREGARDYEFAAPPPMALPSAYSIAGLGSLKALFAPCGQGEPTGLEE